jgi:hypothetical protein
MFATNKYQDCIGGEYQIRLIFIPVAQFTRRPDSYRTSSDKPKQTKSHAVVQKCAPNDQSDKGRNACQGSQKPIITKSVFSKTPTGLKIEEVEGEIQAKESG